MFSFWDFSSKKVLNKKTMYVRCYNYNEMCRVRDEKFVHLLMILSVRPYGICSTILQKEQTDQ